MSKWNWKEKREKPAFLALEDGTILRGYSVGAKRDNVGEVVFNTGMSGYQEILSDPSYSGQFVTMTYTQIGNTGINVADMESRQFFANGFIMHETSESRRGGNGQDLTSLLVNAEVDGERLSADELASFFVLLCVAGNETTRNAISWGLHYLTKNPDQRALWQADIDGVTPTAVEEIVRISSPVIHFRRTVTTDGVRLGDHEVSAGDEEVFTDPDRFDVTRDPNPHVGFGGPGPHFCLGAHLARREIGVMFRQLLTRLPDIEATDEPDRLRTNFVNGIKHLPCAYTPA